MDEVVNAEEGSSMAAARLEQEVRGRERGTDLEIPYAKSWYIVNLVGWASFDGLHHCPCGLRAACTLG